MGIDILEDKVIKLADSLKLYEDMECLAQCYVVETNIEEESGMLTACIVVKKGIIRIDD